MVESHDLKSHRRGVMGRHQPCMKEPRSGILKKCPDNFGRWVEAKCTQFWFHGLFYPIYPRIFRVKVEKVLEKTAAGKRSLVWILVVGANLFLSTNIILLRADLFLTIYVILFRTDLFPSIWVILPCASLFLSIHVILVCAVQDRIHRIGDSLRIVLIIFIENSESILSKGIPLLGGLLVPNHRLGMVLWDSLALVVADSKMELGIGIPLFCSHPEPPHGLGIVLRNTIPMNERKPKVELCKCIPLLSRLP